MVATLSASNNIIIAFVQKKYNNCKSNKLSREVTPLLIEHIHDEQQPSDQAAAPRPLPLPRPRPTNHKKINYNTINLRF